MNGPLILRALALAIAVLAAIDPAFTRTRTDHPFVSVIAASRDDLADAARLRAQLSAQFRPLNTQFSAAAASVIVGDALPPRIEDLARPVFVVPHAERGPRLAIERLTVPNGGAFDVRAAVTADLRSFGGVGRPVALVLRTDGARAGTTSVSMPSGATPFRAIAPIPPSRHEAMLLRVEVRGAGGEPAIADVAYAPGLRQWKILFHDARMSWASTFVRRAAERDPQFSVSSRIATTRGVVSGANTPPRLDDRAAMEDVDLVVVGAPDLLGASDVAALDWFMRDRGGSVVLILDDFAPAAAPALARLVGAGEWKRRSGGDPVLAKRTDALGESLRAIEMTWPARLPEGAEAIAVTNVSSRSDSARHPVVWGVQAGAGHLVVSGALDAWRFRDASRSSFEMFWRALLSEEAARAVPGVEVELAPSVAAPGEMLNATVRLRAGARWNGGRLAVGAHARLRDARGATVPIRIWPGAGVGTFVATFRAPVTPGDYELMVSSGPRTAGAPLVVSTDPRPPHALAREALAAFATSTGGAVLDGRDIAGTIRAALKPVEMREPWHPMRNPWWIVPFALLLSAEWWSRRRAGRA